MKILASLKSRQDQPEVSGQTSNYVDSSRTTSRLLVPTSPTPTLDYLEDAVKGRAKYLTKLLATYRAIMARSVWNGTDSSTAYQDGDFMTKLLKAKYLRTGSKIPAIKDKKRAAVNMAIERLEKALSLGKFEAALDLADLHLVSIHRLAGAVKNNAELSLWIVGSIQSDARHQEGR